MNQKQLQELFDYDYKNGGLIWKINLNIIKKKHNGKRFGFIETKGYIKGNIEKRTYREHRLVWIWHNGDIAKNMEIDHINRNKSDNRIENLRLATHKQNMQNRKDNWKKYYTKNGFSF